MPSQDPTPVEALHELHEILLLIALEHSPQRLTATRYTLCRDILLHSELSPSLPGFLRQCLTVDRFRDFIHLYDASLEARMGLVEDALRGCIGRARAKALVDVLRDPELGLQ